MGRGIKTIALEIKDKASRGLPYTLTFAPTGSLSKEEITELEAFLKQKFELWDSLNAKRGYPWVGNWWVWRIPYKKLE